MWRWDNVCDAGPLLNQHWDNVSWLVVSKNGHMATAVCYLTRDALNTWTD